jgi:hypothetical protein
VLCDSTTTSTRYCCYADTCLDPVVGSLKRITCPDAYGDTIWWFDPGTDEMVGHQWSTDYNVTCNYEAFGMLFGPDLRLCL